jgi:D-glycero-D-manno-heptose 1,7-bisphosphate phosphatase
MKIIFLDRDGVIGRFPGAGFYVERPEDFHFLPNAKKAIALLTQAGFEIHVISNQGCVSKKIITRKMLGRITQKMLSEITEAGGKIKKVSYCVHQSLDHCGCKKPKTLLLKKALGKRKVDVSKLYFIGDSKEDMETGKNFGCQTVLVLSGRNKKSDVKNLPVKPDFVKKDLWEAACWILKKR